MEEELPFSEEELEEAFRLSPEYGIEALHEKCHELLLRYIKHVGLGLDWSEAEDVYQDTMRSMLRAARKPGFDPSYPLRLAQHIAKKRTVDARRRKGYRVRAFEGDEEVKYFAADLKDTDLRRKVKYQDPVVWQEFRDALRECVEKLPEMQRVTALCFVDLYMDLRERDMYVPLAEAVSGVLGKRVTVAAVKSAWTIAKGRIVEELTRRKFNFLDRSEP